MNLEEGNKTMNSSSKRLFAVFVIMVALVSTYLGFIISALRSFVGI